MNRKQMMAMMMAGEESLLPAGYKECEYIQCTGEGNNQAYIDSGIKSSSELRVVAKIENATHNDWVFFYGVRHANSTKVFLANSYKDRAQGFTITGSNYGTSYRTTSSVAHTFDINKFRLIYDDVEYPSSAYDTWTGTLNMIVCGFSENGTIASAPKAKYYYFKIYDGDTLVRDYVPAYKESNGKYGLYDLVNGVFYSSARSGKEFSGKLLTT